MKVTPRYKLLTLLTLLTLFTCFTLLTWVKSVFDSIKVDFFVFFH